MIGEARFTYTDEDMVAAQRAGWTWQARWRNVIIVFVVIAAGESAILAVLNAAFGTRWNTADPVFVVVAAAALTGLLVGLLAMTASIHARQVLQSNRALAWNGDELRGEQAWTWDAEELHIRHDRGHADLSWAIVGAWLDTPKVLLLFPCGARAFKTPEGALAAGWRDAPKVFLYPAGGHALALPKRVLPAGCADDIVDVLRTRGARERRGFAVGAT